MTRLHNRVRRFLARRAAGGRWPRPEQELLLQACLSSGDTARRAWHLWNARVKIDDVDLETPTLFPLLDRNLRAQGIESPLQGMFKGALRRTWTRNQILFRRASAALWALERSKVEAMLVDGAALANLYYQDLGLRWMRQIDLLLPRPEFARAVEALRSSGWLLDGVADGLSATGIVPRRPGARLIDESGQGIDLCWSVLAEAGVNDLEDAFREGAVWTRVNGFPMRAPNAADSLLLVCAQGPCWGFVPPLQWIADAVTIVRAAGPHLDWNRLTGLAERAGLALPVREALSYLDRQRLLALPAEILPVLQEMPVSRVERQRYRRRNRPPGLMRILRNHGSAARAPASPDQPRKIAGSGSQ